MQKRSGILFTLSLLFLLGSITSGYASRFSLFALDIQVPHEEGQPVGEIRKLAIDKGLQEAVEEATYKIIPDQGLDTTYEKLKTNIFDKASQFVPQYKILGEKTYPGTFELSLQVTVDTVLLRRALLKIGFLKILEKGTEGPATLEIRNLVSGTILMKIMDFSISTRTSRRISGYRRPVMACLPSPLYRCSHSRRLSLRSSIRSRFPREPLR